MLIYPVHHGALKYIHKVTYNQLFVKTLNGRGANSARETMHGTCHEKIYVVLMVKIIAVLNENLLI